MDNRLYFESLEKLSHKDTWVHYYFVYYKTFVIFSFFFFLSMIPSLTLCLCYKRKHQIILEAARIVTGLPIFASSILIYKELGWESLTERRKRRKLQMFYNIQNSSSLKLQLIKFIRICHTTIIPYFTSIFKNWSETK
jgi:hypothetical protein